MQSSYQAHTQTGLKRTLSIRHLVMLSLGGSIGTGLFLASGAPVSQAGPSGALLAYALIGVMVYFLVRTSRKSRRRVYTSRKRKKYEQAGFYRVL